MPRGAKPGERRGGRAKGTPNKATQRVRDKLAALGCGLDDIEGMVALSRDPDIALPIRVRLLMKLMRLCYRKPRPI